MRANVLLATVGHRLVAEQDGAFVFFRHGGISLFFCNLGKRLVSSILLCGLLGLFSRGLLVGGLVGLVGLLELDFSTRA